MIVLGLTGSIAMGKSTAARLLAQMGVPVHDSDGAVHDLTRPGGAAVPLINAAFPGVVRDGRIDRQCLGDIVFGDSQALKTLEGILHPMVAERANRFLSFHARQHRRCVALDIPLLLESRHRRPVDLILVVMAPRFVQYQRVLRRPGMTVEKFRRITARQMPDAEKCRLADHIIPSGLGRGETWRRLAAILAAIDSQPGRIRQPSAWPPGLSDGRHRRRLGISPTGAGLTNHHRRYRWHMRQ